MLTGREIRRSRDEAGFVRHRVDPDPGGVAEISRRLSASDTTGSSAQKRLFDPGGIAAEAQTGEGSRRMIRAGMWRRGERRRPFAGTAFRSWCWHPAGMRRWFFGGTLIRWCRRGATQPPANLCHPSGIKRERALGVQAVPARREDRPFRASSPGLC